MPTDKPLHWGALTAGVLTFIGLFALLNLFLLFALALFAGHLDTAWLYGGIKVLGITSWVLPGFVAARIAGRRGWLHGLLTGLLVGALVAVSMTFTFSWEGTVHDEVRDRLLPVFVLVVALCTLGGTLAGWLKRAGNTMPTP